MIKLTLIIIMTFCVVFGCSTEKQSINRKASLSPHKSEIRSIPPCSGEVYTIQVSTNNGICYIHQLIPSEGKILIDKQVLKDLADLIYIEIQKKEKAK